MGRRKEPLERLAARSPDGKTPGKRNLPERIQSHPDHTVPAVPEDITGRGEVEWRKIWVSGFWLKRDQDYPWVEMICQAYTDIEQYREYVRENGLITKGYAGQDAANPMIAEIRKCEQTIQKCLSILGFSPTDRARLAIVENQAQNALQEMIARSRA